MPSTTWPIGRKDRYLPTWFLSCQGIIDAIDSAMYRRLSCLKIAPLGVPVVPEEYRSVAVSPKLTGAVREVGGFVPFERNSSQVSIFLWMFSGSFPRQS